MKQVASLRYGVIFKKAFSQPDIFKAFVKDFLNIELEIDQVETEKSFSPPIGRVDSHFDLYAEDKRNRVIVDIQHVKFPDHYDRFLHYHCAAMLEQVGSAESYSPNLKVFTIVVLTSGDKHQVPMAVIDFDPKNMFTGKPLGEIAHRVLYLCPKYVDETTPEPYRQWLLAIDDSFDGEVEESHYTHPRLRQVFDLIERDEITPQERARMKDEYGYEQLRQEKYQEGLAVGKHAEKIAIAQNLLTTNLDILTIAQVTGLSEPEIEKLRGI